MSIIFKLLPRILSLKNLHSFAVFLTWQFTTMKERWEFLLATTFCFGLKSVFNSFLLKWNVNESLIVRGFHKYSLNIKRICVSFPEKLKEKIAKTSKWNTHAESLSGFINFWFCLRCLSELFTSLENFKKKILSVEIFGYFYFCSSKKFSRVSPLLEIFPFLSFIYFWMIQNISPTLHAAFCTTEQ